MHSDIPSYTKLAFNSSKMIQNDSLSANQTGDDQPDYTETDYAVFTLTTGSKYTYNLWCEDNFLILVVPFLCLKACAQRFRCALFAFIHTQTYFEYYTLTLRLASLVKKNAIYAYWTKELFDICCENVSHMATLPSVARHVIHADNLRPRH